MSQLLTDLKIFASQGGHASLLAFLDDLCGGGSDPPPVASVELCQQLSAAGYAGEVTAITPIVNAVTKETPAPFTKVLIEVTIPTADPNGI